MIYTEEMMLHSDSGYCMPFEERNGDVQMSLGYGEQKHPKTGEDFFHHGVDFNVDHYLLSALASGTVSGMGNDPVHGIYQRVRYGKYEVTYGHLSHVYANFGQLVRAGQTISISDRLLHLEVTFDGEELNPIEFLTMLYGNIKVMQQSGFIAEDTDDTGFPDAPFSTKYDEDRKKIEELMMQFLPDYFTDIIRGLYQVTEHMEQSLRNLFSVGAAKEYFYEKLPSISNPLGLGKKAMPLAMKAQNLLIEDFLNYLALRQNIYLHAMSDGLKKKPMTKS